MSLKETSVAWTFADDYLVLGTGQDTLQKVLRLAAKQGDTPLSASLAYRQALAEAGGRVPSVFLLDATKISALLDRTPLQQRNLKPGQAGPGGTQSPDLAKMQRALHTLQGVSAVSALENDAIITRMTLSLDLNK